MTASVELYQKALNIAFTAHKEQTDKAGMPYILHPLRLMFAFEDITLRIIAVLHDVIEDSDVTVEDLKKEGFTQDIVDAVVALTHKPEESYEAFILRAGNHPLALRVKIADIEDNMDIRRLPILTPEDHQRMEKYHHHLQYLKQKI